jgi:hypothetical protein
MQTEEGQKKLTNNRNADRRRSRRSTVRTAYPLITAVERSRVLTR